MSTVQYEDRHCPYCANVLNAATASEDIVPQPGDISMCFYCGELSTFGEGDFVKPDEAKREELQGYLNSQNLYIQSILRERYRERMKRMN